MVLGRFLSLPQLDRSKEENLPTEDGNSSTAVPLKYKYLVFPGMLGNLVTFEQPETSTITIDFNKQILSGRFPSCLVPQIQSNESTQMSSRLGKFFDCSLIEIQIHHMLCSLWVHLEI